MNLSKKDVEFLDLIIAKLGVVEQQTAGVMTALEIDRLVKLAKRSFSSQEILLKLDPPVMIMGDIHGQYRDLLAWFAFGDWPPKSRYLFLGDYVDRGPKSIEVISLLLALKVRHPNDVYLLRGNHENRFINRMYGFYEECRQRYSRHVWHTFQKAFNMMPLCALVGDRIWCMHGGLPRHLKSLEDLKRFKRPFEVPDEGIVCDLLWADPKEKIKGWRNNEERGVSWQFGEDVVHEYCKKFDLDLIVRAHEVFDEGYKMFASGRLITIFSAPNYAGVFRNAAAMLSVSEQMQLEIKTARARTEKPTDDVASEEETMTGDLGDRPSSNDNGPLWMRRALNQMQQLFESHGYSLHHPGQSNPPKRWWRATMKAVEAHLSYRSASTAPIELTVLVKSEQAPAENQRIVVTKTSTLILKAHVVGGSNKFDYAMQHRTEYDTKPLTLASLDKVVRAEIEEKFFFPVLEAAKASPQKRSWFTSTMDWIRNRTTQTASKNATAPPHVNPTTDAKSTAPGKQPESKPIEPKSAPGTQQPESTPTPGTQPESKPIAPKPTEDKTPANDQVKL